MTLFLAIFKSAMVVWNVVTIGEYIENFYFRNNCLVEAIFIDFERKKQNGYKAMRVFK